MKTAIILKEHLANFAELDPFGFLERADFPDRVCIGTVMEKKDGGDDIPAALMVLHIMEDKVIVEWLYVRDEMRKKGIGSELMAQAYKVALSSGYDRLYLSRSKNPNRNQLCLYEDDFLAEYNFEDEKPLPGEWTCSISDLIDNPRMSKIAENYKDTVSLKNLDEEKKQALEEFLSGKDSEDFLFESSFALDLSDEEVSRVLIEDGIIKGAIFVQNVSDELYVTGLCGNEKKDNLDLCFGATMSASKKYGMDMPVHVLKYNDKNLDLVKELIKGQPLRTSICSSSVEDYYEAVDELELLYDSEEIDYGLLREEV